MASLNCFFLSIFSNTVN